MYAIIIMRSVGRMKLTRLAIFGVSAGCLVGVGLILSAADNQSSDNSSTPAAADQPKETVAKPLSERAKKRKQEQLRKELETPYKKWLDEDVRYIITDEE